MSLQLDHLRVMLVNDDGIDAPGIKLLEEVVAPHIPDLWVVAPDQERSGASRQISLRQDIEVEQRGPRHFAVGGTPTDCALIGIRHILADRRPDIVLSGINAGGNLGEDIGYSGTCGACFEALQNGVPAVAFSQARIGHNTKGLFSAAEASLPTLLADLVQHAIERQALLNVNFPPCDGADIKGVRVTSQGQREDSAQLEEQGTGESGKRRFFFSQLRSDVPRALGTDIDSVRHGYVSVTPLASDFTDYRGLTRLTVALNLHR